MHGKMNIKFRKSSIKYLAGPWFRLRFTVIFFIFCISLSLFFNKFSHFRKHLEKEREKEFACPSIDYRSADSPCQVNRSVSDNILEFQRTPVPSSLFIKLPISLHLTLIETPTSKIIIIIIIIIIISFLKPQDLPTGILIFRVYLSTRPSQTSNV